MATRKMLNAKKTVCLVGLALLSASISRAYSMDLQKVGFRETGGVHVANGTETVSGSVILDSTARFYKTGDGKLILPLSQVNAQADYSMAVLGGTLELTSGTDATVNISTPPMVCQTAAFWVDPDSVVLDGNSVVRWCDVREPVATRAVNQTPSYVYAMPRWYHPTEGNADMPPEKVSKHGREAVYFGGHLAGRYLKWSRTIEKIQAIFLVHGVYDTFGAVVGYSVKTRSGGFVPEGSNSSTKPYSALTAHFLMRGDFSSDLHSMTAFLDGKPLDAMRTPPIKGFQLLECHFAPIVTQADTFFFSRAETLYSESNLNSHQGGDYLAEAIVFTNVITEAQRLDVQRYLMKKWHLPRNRFTDVDDNPQEIQLAKPVGTIGVAAGATAVVNVSANEETSPLSFNGEGAIIKKGAGTLVTGADASGKPSSASLTLDEGTVISRHGGRLPPLKLVGGSRYTAEAWNPVGTAAESSEKGGLRLSRASEGLVTQVIKDGDGWARANEIDADVTLLNVQAGVLQLEAKAAEAAYVDGGVVTGFIANADFEMPFEERDGKGWGPSMSWTTVNGWIGSGVVRYFSRGGWAWNAYGVNSDSYGPTDGENVLFMAAAKMVSTTINLPVAGVYELSFLARARCGAVRLASSSADFNKVQHFEIGFADNAYTAPRRFASFVVNDGPVQRVRVLLPEKAAGTYCLMFKSQGDDWDPSGLTLDDMRLTLVGEKEQTVAFAVPNGGAEYQPSLSSQPYHHTSYSAENPVEGWTFTDGAGEAMSGEYPLAGATGLSTFMNNGSSFRPAVFFNYWDRPLGTGSLAFFGRDGHASTMFTAPAGTFRLRAGLARCMHYKSNTDYSAEGTISAKLVLSNGEERELGSLTAKSHLMTSGIWPNAFTIEAAQTVMLVLTQDNFASTLVDDLVFVAADEATYGELVMDGDFEDSSHDYWKRPSTAIAKMPYTTAPIDAYGWTAMSGARAARLTGPKAHYYQTITVPCSGLYRLKVAVRSRISDDQWSRNPVQFTLTKNGSTVTNEIGRVDPMPLYRQFEGFEYLFNVEEPGDYTFSIKAVDHSVTDSHADDRQCFVDDISITRVRETPSTFVSPPEMCVTVASGAQVRLDFTNSVPVARLRIDGRNVYGVANASTHPQYISGPGSFTVKSLPPGMVINFH